ncbi:MerR family transcriptional regulator [Paenibacillus sp. TAB 01]|uniref:MerR family transcriptional regulator n=1 Tax=Paenibacillus sp. TAB 01 TaxID=3368988 RepID=UPI0037523EB6
MTIQHMSELTGLSVHTLRYYEKIGLLEGISRNGSGYREYSESDLLWVEFLIRLRETGMPIREMKEFSILRAQGEATVTPRRQLLEQHQAKVLEQIEALQQNLTHISSKIAHYKEQEKALKMTNHRGETEYMK